MATLHRRAERVYLFESCTCRKQVFNHNKLHGSDADTKHQSLTYLASVPPLV